MSSKNKKVEYKQLGVYKPQERGQSHRSKTCRESCLFGTATKNEETHIHIHIKAVEEKNTKSPWFKKRKETRKSHVASSSRNPKSVCTTGHSMHIRACRITRTNRKLCRTTKAKMEIEKSRQMKGILTFFFFKKAQSSKTPFFKVKARFKLLQASRGRNRSDSIWHRFQREREREREREKGWENER